MCYEREMLRSSKLMEGRLLLRWTINGRGRATDLQVVKDGLGNPDLVLCIRDRIQSWIFPPCPRECTVVYPFDFSPSAASHS